MKYSIEICEAGFPVIMLDGKRSGIPTDPEKEFWEEIQRLRRENKRLQRRNETLHRFLSPKPTE